MVHDGARWCTTLRGGLFAVLPKGAGNLLGKRLKRHDFTYFRQKQILAAIGLGGGGLNELDGLADGLLAEVVGAVMHRDELAGACGFEALPGLLGAGVGRLHKPGWLVGAYADEGVVELGEVLRHFGKMAGGTRITTKPQSLLLPFDDEGAPESTIGVGEVAAAPVLGGHETDARLIIALGILLIPASFHQALLPGHPRLNERGHAECGEDAEVEFCGKLFQSALIAMVAVVVAQQDIIESTDFIDGVGSGYSTPQHAESIPNRVDEVAAAIELKQKAGVSKPADPVARLLNIVLHHSRTKNVAALFGSLRIVAHQVADHHIETEVELGRVSAEAAVLVRIAGPVGPKRVEGGIGAKIHVGEQRPSAQEGVWARRKEIRTFAAAKPSNPLMLRVLTLQILAVATLAVTTLHAQISTPAPSPSAKVMQTIGLTDVNVEYSRPAMKGRAIFGEKGLVPYGEMWRTGANKNTIVTFSKPVTIGGKEVKAGSYSVFTKPMANEWEVYFYTDTENWGTPEAWDETKVAAKVMAKTMMSNMATENFTIYFDKVLSSTGEMHMAWDKTHVVVPISVGTDKETMASIDKVMKGPGAGDYYSAASYFADNGKDMKQAYEWIKKATAMNTDAFWMVRRQSLIEAELGMKKEAIASAKKSMDMAQKAGNMDYVRMNEASIKEWSM